MRRTDYKMAGGVDQGIESAPLTVSVWSRHSDWAVICLGNHVRRFSVDDSAEQGCDVHWLRGAPLGRADGSHSTSCFGKHAMNVLSDRSRHRMQGMGAGNTATTDLRYSASRQVAGAVKWWLGVADHGYGRPASTQVLPMRVCRMVPAYRTRLQWSSQSHLFHRLKIGSCPSHWR